MKHFQDAIDFVRSGKMGEISLCRAWSVNPMNGWLKPMPTPGSQNAPAGFDYDFWLGPAPKRAYDPNRSHFTWRWFFDYGGGLMTDWGVHMIDILLLGLQQSDPLTVASAGGIFAMKDERDTPDTMQAVYRFPNTILQWENRFNNGRGLDGGIGHGAEFIGTNGTLIVDRNGYQYFPEQKDGEQPPPSKREESTHWQNFLECVKTRQTPHSGIESMAKTTMICHLGNIALQSGKTLHWDAKKQEVENHRDVKHCISYEREYRKPWKLKTYKA
jgi:predicted dehydrogenase